MLLTIQRKSAPSNFRNSIQTPFRTKMTIQNNQITLYHRFCRRKTRYWRQATKVKKRKKYPWSAQRHHRQQRQQSRKWKVSRRKKSVIVKSNRSVGRSLIVKSECRRGRSKEVLFESDVKVGLCRISPGQFGWLPPRKAWRTKHQGQEINERIGDISQQRLWTCHEVHSDSDFLCSRPRMCGGNGNLAECRCCRCSNSWSNCTFWTHKTTSELANKFGTANWYPRINL